MSLTLKRQYDKRSFLLSVLNRRFKSVTSLGRDESDPLRLKRILALEDRFRAVSDGDLRERTSELKEAVQSEKRAVDDIVEEGFAIVREASRRATGLFHYPEQILGGLALVRGCVAEQATGEGKTLTITLPAYSFALTGRGVHVVTVNSYLAERDRDFVRPIFDLLGLEVGILPEKGTPEAKKKEYEKDVLYGVGYEFGFDYLRDQLRLLRSPRRSSTEQLCDVLLEKPVRNPLVIQKQRAFAIVDEIDSVLVDEAASPLVISESVPMHRFNPLPYVAARDLAGKLIEGEHYTVEARGRQINLSPNGTKFIHDSIDTPWHLLCRPWQSYVQNALNARLVFKRDVNYVVQDGKIVIIDEFTGRAHSERTWRSGLHQAVEAGEDVPVNPETNSAASTTRQRYFAAYDRICGLSGTAAEAAGEFWHFFRMPVVQIPLHKPCRRSPVPERVFRSRAEMLAAVVEDVSARLESGQPVLIGTRTISLSEALSTLMEKRGTRHRLLTAKQDKEESDIVAGAGQVGSVVIATNMAGRGTHIAVADEAMQAGGLHVIGIERNDSLRIDRQLVGRTGRQGQPGTVQFFVSAEDHIIEKFDPKLGDRMKKAPATRMGELPESFSRDLDRLQEKVEKLRYQQRLLMAYRDEWSDRTRESLA